MYNAPTLNNEETGNLKRPIISKEVELVLKNLPTKNVQDQTASQWILPNTPRRIYINPSKTSPKLEEEETLPNSFYKASITLILKPDKNDTRKLQIYITDKHRCKNPQQNISKPNSTIH